MCLYKNIYLILFMFLQLQQILQTFQQPQKPQSPVIDNTVMAQVQAITAQLKTTAAQPPEQKAAFPPPEQKTSFDKVSLHLFYVFNLFSSAEDCLKGASVSSICQEKNGADFLFVCLEVCFLFLQALHFLRLNKAGFGQFMILYQKIDFYFFSPRF